MSCAKVTKLIVYPSTSSLRSVTGPYSPPCVALSFETFGIATPSVGVASG